MKIVDLQKRIAEKRAREEASFPKTAWRMPPSEWLISLKRFDGSKEYHSVQGSLVDARKARDDLLKTGRYELAWLIDKDRVPPKDRRPVAARKTLSQDRQSTMGEET